jgi:hypothetical protein
MREAVSPGATSGYTWCACRDCMELGISSDQRKQELCAGPREA